MEKVKQFYFSQEVAKLEQKYNLFPKFVSVNGVLRRYTRMTDIGDLEPRNAILIGTLPVSSIVNREDKNFSTEGRGLRFTGHEIDLSQVGFREIGIGFWFYQGKGPYFIDHNSEVFSVQHMKDCSYDNFKTIEWTAVEAIDWILSRKEELVDIPTNTPIFCTCGKQLSIREKLFDGCDACGQLVEEERKVA